MNYYDLIICVRCHLYPDLIADTIDSVRYCTDPRTTRVMAAVDGAEVTAKALREKDRDLDVYLSKRNWGWGPGLWSLMLESIQFAESKWIFGHFMSIDYDTYFIGKGADQDILGLISSSRVGLIGQYSANNMHWAQVFANQRVLIENLFGSVPRTYIPGEGVQGGCITVTRVMIEKMKAKGMFRSPFLDAKDHGLQMADDHWVSYICRMCGLQIVDSAGITRCQWTASRDPRGLEKEGVKIFHPTKLKPRSEKTVVEKEIRNYFRQLRGRPLLP